MNNLLVACIATGLLSVALAAPMTPEANNDKITSLPGLASPPPFDMYAGYLEVDAAHGRNLFYWLVESQSNPATDPVFLWTNGGPGCSGLIGFFTESGPFYPNPDGATLTLNYAEAWNNAANIMYIEAPAGVGFSYSHTESDYNTGDAKTAADNYKAILVFLQRFPQFAASSFFISSESYGGHYMPTLAQAIVEGNNAGVNPKINFKGFLVGNPYTDPYENAIGQYGTWAGHSLVSKPTADGLYAHCFQAGGPDAQCDTYETYAQLEVGDLDPYGLDFPICTTSAEANKLLSYVSVLHKKSSLRQLAHTVSSSQDTSSSAAAAPGPVPYDPCRDSYLQTYLSRPDVIAAIHANPNLGYNWTECSSPVLNYNQTDLQNPMEPIYQWLLKNAPELKITVYSGDDDSVCGGLGTQHWLYGLGLPQSATWTQWTDASGQTGGYVVKFKGITFVTVHTAGHMVPTFQPARALQLFQGFISGRF